MFARLAILLVLSSIATGDPKPNILLILTEDQGAQAGFLGTPGIRTPHTDRLAGWRMLDDRLTFKSPDGAK